MSGVNPTKRALIYAAGKGSRWHGDLPKQLVEVEGESILGRQLRQFKAHRIEPYVVANDPQIVAATKAGGGTPVSVDMATARWVAETMLRTQDMWAGSMIGTFGDVWFSDYAMEIIATSSGLKCFGRRAQSVMTLGPAEIWAFGWEPEHNARMRESLQVAVDAAEVALGDRDPGGTPHGGAWPAYRHMAGVPLETHGFDKEGIWVEINDMTDDPVDDPHRFAAWSQRMSRRFVCGAPASEVAQ